MPSTTVEYFANAVNGTGGTTWNNPENVTVEAGFSDNSFDSTDPAVTDDMFLDTPLSGSQIPPTAIITGIEIIIRVQVNNLTGGTRFIDQITIFGGNQHSEQINDTAENNYTFSGDLAYWGLTQQEARDFADNVGASDIRIRGVKNGTNASAEMYMFWVTAQFTYDAVLVNAPVMF